MVFLLVCCSAAFTKYITISAFQGLLGAVPGKLVARDVLQLITAARTQFARGCHANRCISLGAQTAENALTQIEHGGAFAIPIFTSNGCCRANACADARILPVGPINLRLAARVAGDFYRRLRITRCDDACLQTLTKSFKHNQRSVPEYEKLKLLFTTGKSGMMLPRMASVNAGQF